jgi:hypothetical protein
MGRGALDDDVYRGSARRSLLQFTHAICADQAEARPNAAVLAVE